MADSYSLLGPHEPTAADLDAITPHEQATPAYIIVAARHGTVSWCHCAGSAGGNNGLGRRARSPGGKPPHCRCRACSRPSGPAEAAAVAAIMPPLPAAPTRLGTTCSAVAGLVTRSRSFALATPPTDAQWSDLPPQTATPTAAAPAPSSALRAPTEPFSARTRSRCAVRSTGSWKSLQSTPSAT